MPQRNAAPITHAPRHPPRRTARVLGVLVLAVAMVGAGACQNASRKSGAARAGVGAAASAGASAAASANAAARAAATAASMSDVDLVGQVLVPELYGESATSVTAAAAKANLKMAGARTPAQIVAKYRLGGVILANRAADDPTAATNQTTNIATADQVRSLDAGLQDAAARLPANAPLLIGTDQEYGVVTRLRSGVVQLPSAMALGAAHDASLTRSAWTAAGNDLASLGMNVDFAPDADVIADAGNTVIGSRSFGSDAVSVSTQVSAAVTGLHGAGLATAIKHFPGHGDTDTDSHSALPVLSQSRSRLSTVDLAPFRAGIAAGTDMVMVGHLDVTSIDPGMPATFSHKVITDLLRGELGFRGVVITDAMNMAPAKRWPPGEAAVRAVLAGDDMLLMPPDVAAAQQGLLSALRSGRLPHAQLVASVTRILTMKYRLAAGNATSSSGHAADRDSAAEQATAAKATASAITVLAGACHGPLVTGPVTVASTPGYAGVRNTLAAALRSEGVQVTSTGGAVIDLVGYDEGRDDLVPGAAVTVAVDTPYVLGYATSPVRIATYSSTSAAMRALAAVIAGRAPAPGTSPVAVAGLPRTACGSGG